MPPSDQRGSEYERANTGDYASGPPCLNPESDSERDADEDAEYRKPGVVQATLNGRFDGGGHSHFRAQGGGDVAADAAAVGARLAFRFRQASGFIDGSPALRGAAEDEHLMDHAPTAGRPSRPALAYAELPNSRCKHSKRKRLTAPPRPAHQTRDGPSQGRLAHLTGYLPALWAARFIS